MQRLFDHDVATPARPKADPAKKRQALAAEELHSGAPQAIWALLLDRGADPLALATLLRDGVPVSERRRAYIELVRDLGPALATRVWTEAFVARGLKRAALPSDARDVAEAALGESLDGVQLVSGPAVEALTARLGTPAFTVGQEVFVGAGGGESSVLVHEAIHAAQQRGAAATGRPGAPSDAAERDVHRVLRRIGPMGRGDRFARERARTAMAVRAALGRAPRVTSRPLQMAAYEATHGIVDAVQGEAKKLVEALVKLLDGNADRVSLQKVLGDAADGFAERIRRTALHELGARTTADGKDARQALAHKLGNVDPLSGERRGKPLPSAVRSELESRLALPLGDVRLHDDAAAAAEAKRLGALAFTQGQDVFFADGKLDASSTEGKRLLAHEVAHVAQQAGSPATGSPSVSAPGSAVEREADRVANAVVAGPQPGQGPIAVHERAAAGTISKKDDSAAGGGGKFAVNLYTFHLDTDTSTGVDTGDGMKKLTLNQTKFGPVSLDELKVQLDGDKVSRGTLKAHLDDGKFRGTSTTLNVDGQGNVSGQLDLGLKAPGAFAKNVKVTVNNDGLSAKANISASDFVGKDFPVKAAGDMAVQVQNGAAGLDVTMIGASTVELDAGFAGGQGTMTAVILPGSINATVAAKFSVPGLGSEIEASIKWDGKTIDIAATASLQVTIPGLAGTAKVTYKGGKLDVDIPDLKFVADALQALKFAKQQVEEGKLKGKVTVAGSVAFESAGAQVTLNGSSTLAIDGSEIAGKASGTFGIGPKGSTLVEGAFDVGMADGGFDGSVTLSKANVSFLQANNVTATVKGIGKAKPSVKVTGDIAVNLGDVVKGSVKGLSYDGGSPTGDVSIDVKIPQVTVPQLNFTLGSGWSIKSAAKELKAAIDFADGVLGNLSQLDLDLSLKDGGTLPKLSSVLGDLVVKAKSVSVPGFEGLGTLDDFNLKIPGSGGNYQFGQSSGNANLTINLGSKPTKVAIAVHEGKVSAKVKSEVDIHEIASALTGKIKIGIDTAAAEKLSIEATDVHASDPELAKQLVVSKASIKGGKLTAQASVAGQLSYGGMTLNVAECHLNVDSSASPGFSGSAKFSVAGEGAKADITATVNKDGKFDIAGESDIDLAALTGGAVTGKVHAAGGSAGGLKKFNATGAKITKKPFDAVTIKSIGYDKASDHLDIDLEVKADALNMPGLKLDKLDGAVHFVKTGGAVGFDGHLKSAGIGFQAGDTAVGSGSLDLTYKAGVVTGNAELKTLALKFGSFAATVNNFKLDLADGTPKAAAGSEPSVNVKQEGLFDVTMKAKFGASGIEQFDVTGAISETPITKLTTGQATWKPGKATTFKVEGLLNDLGGLIDGDKKFHVGYDGAKIDAGIEKFTVEKGDLKGWSIGGSVSGKDIDVEIESPDSGQAWTFGNIEISLVGKNKLKYTTATGASGDVKGKVKIGEASVAVGAKFANSKITSVSAEADNIEIHDIISPLSGKFSISYDSAKKDLKSKGSGIKPSDPELAHALQVDYTYENKTFTGTFTSQPNAPFSVGPLSGRITECMVKCTIGPGQTAFSGSVSADTASEAGPPSIGKVSYNADGKGLKFEGSFEVDAAGLTGGYVTGRFKVDKGAGGTGLWAKDLNFAKGPLAGKIEAFSGGFDTAKRSFAIDVTITAAALKQVLPSWITAKSALKIKASKDGDKAPLKVDVQGDATFAIEFGEYFSGSISIKKVQEAIAADLTIDKVKFDAGDFKFSGAGKLSYDSSASPKVKVDANSHLDVANDALGVKGSLTALADADGNVNGAKLEGTVGETGLTTEAKFSGSYQAGKKYDISGEATFKPVDGLLDPGAKLALGYNTDDGFHATAENIKFNAGALKGLTVVKAWFTSKGANKGWGINVKGGVDVDLSDDIKAHIDDSSNFTAKGTGNGAPSFSGVVKGTVKVGDLADIKLKFTGAGDDIKIHADNQEGTEIGKLTSDIVTGLAKFQYDGSMKNVKGGRFSFQLESPTVNVGKISGEPEPGGAPLTVPQKLGAIIQTIKGQHTGADGWTGSLTIRDTALEVMGAKIHVHQSTISYKKDKKLDGAIKADGGNEGGSVEAKVEIGWKKGSFYFKGGLDFNVSELTDYAEGKVHADVDSGSGDANLTNLTPIVTKGALAGITITKLRGSKSKKLFKFNAKIKEFLQHAAGGVMPASIKLSVGDDAAIDVEKKGASLSAVGKISADVTFQPGSSPVASGHLDLAFDTAGVHAKASDVQFEFKPFLTGKNINVDFATGLESGSTLTFAVPGVATGEIKDLTIKPKEQVYGFDSKINFDKSLPGLNAVQLGVKLNNGTLTAKADLTKDITFEVASSKLTIGAGSTAEVDTASKKFKAELKGDAVLPSQLGKGNWHVAYDGSGLDGSAHFDIEPVAIFSATAVDVDYKSGKLRTKSPVKLNVDDKFGQYFAKPPNITLEYGDNLKVAGNIEGPLKGLGVIGDSFEHGSVSFDTASKQLHADGKFNMAKLKGLSKSTLLLFIDGTKFGIKGDIVSDDIDGVKFTQNKLSLEWTKGTPFKISGGFAGAVTGLADFDIQVSAGGKETPGGGTATMAEDKPSFTATGKLTATGVQKYLPDGVRITPPSAVLFVSMDETGKWDYGVQHLGCRIIAIPGVDEIDAGFDASFTKAGGLSAHADIAKCRINKFSLDGHVDVEKTKFKGGELHASADFPGVGLDGTIVVKPSQDFGLNFNTIFKVTPKGSSGFAKFVKDGTLEVDYGEHTLKKVEGIINLQPPDFLKELKNPQVKVTYAGGEISAEATCGFSNPFGDDQPDGTLAIKWSTSAGFSAEVKLPVTLPGMKQAEIYGKIDGSGAIELGANFFPDGAVGEFLEQAHIDLSYKGGEFKVEGWIILTPGKDFKLKIGVAYNFSTNQFSVLGLDQAEKPKEDDAITPVAGISEEIGIPLASVGVASLDLVIGFGVSLGYKKPKFEFDTPELVGGLDALKSGKMPAVKFGGKIGVGAAVVFEISIGIQGTIQLLIASASMGIKGVLKAILELNLGADIKGQFEQGKGADIKVDPSVSAALKLRAELHAFLKAKVCFFTILDKDWELGGVDLANIPLGTFKPFEPIEFNIGGPDAGFKNGSPQFKNDKDKIIDGVKSGSQKIGDDAADEDSKQKIHTVLGPIKAAAAQWETLPPNWKDGMTAAPVEFNSFFPGVPSDAWDFYADHADHAEEMDPADACRSPAEKFAKTVAVFSRISPGLAGSLVLGWRRAQVAHVGINPDTGVDVVAEREEVQALIDKAYQEALVAAQAAQAAQDAEHAHKVEKQHTDFAKAEQEHQKKVQETKKQYDDKVHAHEKEAKLATAKAEQAEKDVEKEGAKEKAKPEEKGPPPAPPPAPPIPAPLAKPAPIPVPPPVPLPPPAQQLPSVTLPALPDNGFAPPASKPIPKTAEPIPVDKPSVTPAPPSSVPDGTPGVSSATDKGGGGGGSPGNGFPAKGGGGGGGGGAPPGPQVEAGAAGIISQAKTLDAKKASLGGGKGAPAAGAAAAAPAGGAAAGAPAAGGAAGAKDQKGAATGKDGKKSDAKSGDASVDPTVQAVVDKGKSDEQKQSQDAKQKEEGYHKQTDDKKHKAGAAEAKLNEVAKKQHEKNEKTGNKGPRKMPAAGDFPPATPDQCRTAFSNWTRLKLKGETFTSFTQKMAVGAYFNFETKAWGALLDDYKKVFDAAKPEEVLPDVKDWAAKLFGGSSYQGAGVFKPAGAFDAAFHLSDDQIKAYETFDKFKATNAGHKPGQYLIAEVEKMADTEKATFVNGKLAPLANAAEVVKALRVALDKLGPTAQVQGRVAEIDGGKVVQASQFWTQMVASFNQAVAGIAQVNDLVAKMQAKDPKAADKGDSKAPADGKAPDAKAADGAKGPDGKDAKPGDPKAPAAAAGGDAKKANGKPEAEKAADATKGAPAGADTPAGAKPTPPEMVGWEKVQAQFEAATKGKVDAVAKAFGLDAGAGVDANMAAMIAKRAEQLQRMQKLTPELPPEQIWDVWVNHAAKDNVARLMDAAKALGADFVAKLTAARKEVPRLNPDGVRKAVELLRHATGSATLPALTGVDLNPAGTTPEEKAELSLLSAAVDGADWNPFWDTTWASKIYAPQKFDPTAFATAPKKEEKKDEKADAAKSDAKPADAGGAATPKPGDAKASDGGAKPADGKASDAGAKPADAKAPDAKPADAKAADAGKPAGAGAKPATDPAKADASAAAPKGADAAKDPTASGAKPADAPKPGAVDPDALKAADAKLKLVFNGCATSPTKLATMSEQERIDLATKVEADIRTQLFADFESLVPALNPLQAEKINQLKTEEGFEEGLKDDLVKRFKDAVYAFWIKNGGDFSDAFTKTVFGGGFTFKGKKLLAGDFNTAVPTDKSLSRVIATPQTEKTLILGNVRTDWLAANPTQPDPTDDVLAAFAMTKFKEDANTYVPRYANVSTLVSRPGWVFPEPSIKADAVFSEYCDLLALYANWYPQGHLRLTLKRDSVLEKIAAGGLRKPTVFDGMQSPLWVQRDNRDHNWGKTGGGLREALMAIDAKDIDPTKWECVEIDPKYQAVLDAAKKGAAGTPKDAATIDSHNKGQLDKAQQTQGAQAKEDTAAKGAAPAGDAAAASTATPAPAAGGKGGDAPKSDEPVVADPEPAVTVPFAMSGEPHTLVADPDKDKIDFNSLTPGELLKKILSVLGLATNDGAADLGAAHDKSKQADSDNKSVDLKKGAKKSLRLVAVQKLKAALSAVIASLSAAAAKLGWKDASKQAVDQANKEKKEKEKEGDKDKAPGDLKANDASGSGAAPTAAADGKAADGKAADSKTAKSATATPADGKGGATDGAADKKASGDKPLDPGGKAPGSEQGKQAGATGPDPSAKIEAKPDQKPLDVSRTVAMGSSSVTLHVTGESRAVMVDELKLTLPAAIGPLRTAVSPAAREALEAASARAAELAAAVAKPSDVGPGDALAKHVSAQLDAIARLLTNAGLAGLRIEDLQKDAPAITDDAQAMTAFKKFQSWEALKKEYKTKKDEASMWQLFHARKAHVDGVIKGLCGTKATPKDFGSANNTSDYDLSITLNKPAVPDKVKADREKQPPKSEDTGGAQTGPSAGPGLPEMTQLDAAVRKAAKARAADNAPKPELPERDPAVEGVNTIITQFNEKIRGEFGVEPGIVFDTNVYDGGETLPAALGGAPALTTPEGAATNLEIQDAAALSKIRRYLTGPEDVKPKYQSEQWKDYRAKLIKELKDNPAAKEQLVTALDSAEQLYRDYRFALDEELAAMEEEDRKNVSSEKKPQLPVPPDLIEKDREMRASNRVYAKRIAVVDALRATRQGLLDQIKGAPTDEQKQKLDQITNQIRQGQAEALQAASEAYNSEGSMVDVVVNKQMFGDKDKEAKRLKTTLEEKLQSLNEQMGDSFKEMAHGTPAFGACKASKYAHRFFTVAKDASDALPAGFKIDTSLTGQITKMVAANEGLQKLRQVPDEKQAEQLLSSAETSSGAYRDVFLKVNMSLNAKIRQALAADDQGGAAGGGGGGGKAVG